MFSLSTPDRVYQFSSDNKQLIETWIEILTNACRKNPFFENLDDGQDCKRDKSEVFDESLYSTTGNSIKKSMKDPYIHLTECYSGKFPQAAPPRPAKSSLDVRRKLVMENIENDIQYLDLHFPSLNKQVPDEVEDSDDTDSSFKEGKEEEEIIYHNIDFIKTKAFNETRRQVESDKYNIKPAV